MWEVFAPKRKPSVSQWEENEAHAAHFDVAETALRALADAGAVIVDVEISTAEEVAGLASRVLRTEFKASAALSLALRFLCCLFAADALQRYEHQQRLRHNHACLREDSSSRGACCCGARALARCVDYSC